MKLYLEKMERALEMDAASVAGPEIRPALPASDTRPSSSGIESQPRLVTILRHRAASPDTERRPEKSTSLQAVQVSGKVGLKNHRASIFIIRTDKRSHFPRAAFERVASPCGAQRVAPRKD